MAESLRSRAKTCHRRPSASLPQQDHTPLGLLNHSPIVQVTRNHIPIKQYSNKFLREMQPKPILAVPETLVLNNRRRFNTILPKKLMFCRMTPRQRLRSKNQLDLVISQIGSTSKLAVSNLYKGKRVFTEAAARLSTCQAVAETSIIQLQQQLLRSETFSQALFTPCHAHFSNNQTEPLEERPKLQSEPVIKEQAKISQSRGLELFSKLFIKERSTMTHKVKESPLKVKKVGCHGGENHFAAQTILPVEKTRKKQKMMRSIENRRKVVRTPMRLLDNQFPSPVCPKPQREEAFEINGWETAL